MSCSAMPFSMKRLPIGQLKVADLAVLGQIGIQHDDVFTPLGHFHECFSEGRSHIFAGDFRAGLSGGTADGFTRQRVSRRVFSERRYSLQSHRPKAALRPPSVDPRDQFGVGRCKLLVGRRPRMPRVKAAAVLQGAGVFHKGNTTAFNGVSDEYLGDLFNMPQVLECLSQGFLIVAAAAHHVPGESGKLSFYVLQIDDTVDFPVRLDLVVVNNHRQIADPLVSRGLQGLEILALLQLAVTGHDKHAPAAAQITLGPGHAATLGDAHAQRSRVGLHPGAGDIRMAVQTAQAPQPEQFFHGQQSQGEEHGIQPRYVVALGGKVDVAIGAVQSHPGQIHLAVVQVHHQIHGAETRAQVTGPRLFDRRQSIGTAHVGHQGKARCRIHGGLHGAFECFLWN